MSEKVICLIDPEGKEGRYDRKIQRSWRNFLRLKGYDDGGEWQFQTLEHNKQKDSHSCGVLLLKFAENYLTKGGLMDVLTSESAMRTARMDIACALLEYRGNTTI
ncbi:uncharacterized protein LOC127526503 [Erpetoichthys calabaricus]|uniref:uncharacterized protein LOC127526503 n=1 Tax=Erpetoichthys calabaricus TaxID=27687 RepID=UPI002233FF2B|nr:uncharacterized protein LOC127526503 [Erpetoichthys calabaricus]